MLVLLGGTPPACAPPDPATVDDDDEQDQEGTTRSDVDAAVPSDDGRASDGTTSSESSSESGESPTGPGSDSNDDNDDSAAPACDRPDGIYGNCLEDPGVCGDASALRVGCLTARGDSIGVCSWSGCSSDCDCPPAPTTGTAPSLCVNLEGDGTECILDCKAGQTCPDGMVCVPGPGLCVFEVESTAPPNPYGTCDDGCGPDEPCVQSSATNGVCSPLCDAELPACPQAPVDAQTQPICLPLGGEPACFLECTDDETCPNGMICVDAQTFPARAVCIHDNAAPESDATSAAPSVAAWIQGQ